MHEATVGHFLRGRGNGLKVLLGKRLSVFCNGMWNGAGGKMKRYESPRIGLRRETKEEWGVWIDIWSLKHFASLDFYHPFKGEYRLEWRVHFYQVTQWSGEPIPLEGFSELKWYEPAKFPYKEMLIDDQFWMPTIYNGIADGRLLKGEVHYGDPDMETIDKISFWFVDPKAQCRI